MVHYFEVLVALFLALQLAESRGVLYYEEEDVPADSVCSGQPNVIPPWTGQPTFVRHIDNGSLYTAGNGDDMIYVLHIYGDPYSLGYAHGVLLKEQVNATIAGFYQHVRQEIDNDVHFLPKEISDFISKYGLDGALDLTYEMTKDYIPSYYIEELEGLANGSGVDFKLLLRAHMLPELVKAGCSMLGAWGTSVSNSDGMLQLRALDWDVNGPLQNAPAVIVYHPKNGNEFANVGWAGWIATISGMSYKGLGISEKHSDVKFSQESRKGIPFNFLMRDILQFDNSVFDAMSRIQNAKRTCSIWLGVGDGNLRTFRLVEYSESTANFYDDQNVTQIEEKRFNQEHCNETCFQNYNMTDLVYWGVHLGCWNEELHSKYGKIDAPAIIEMVGRVKTGNLQAVIYDFLNMQVFVANAKGANETGSVNAFDRQFVALNIGNLFTHPKPFIL